MKYNRTELGDGVGYSTVIDGKFKTSSISIRFITKLKAETAAANSLGMGVLSCSNSELKTLAELNERLSSLYGGAFSTFTRKRGDVQILGLSASWINNRYAIDGEDIEGGMLSIVRDCLFSPNAHDGEFDADSFRITRQDLIDRIDGELNNKRSYALSKAAEIAYRDEPAEQSCCGTKESASAVTSREAYSAYRRLLQTAQAEIFYIAPEENPAVEEMFRECFGALDRSAEPNTFRTVSPVKEEYAVLEEELDVRQCKMVLTFKSDSDDIFALRLLSTILGETAVSKLFMNVREKLSLCYYCACRFSGAKNALMIDSGVERDNIPKAREEIIRQLDEIRRGNISDSELENALLSLDNALTGVGDTPGSYSSWYFEQYCEGRILTPEERFTDYKNVTKARIVQAANSLRPDSEYLMLNKPSSDGDKEAQE